MMRFLIIIVLCVFILAPGAGDFTQDHTTLQQVMALHRQTIGGVDALFSFRTAHLTFDLSVDGKAVGELEAWYGEEGLYREIITNDERWSSTSFDGSYAYVINPSTRNARSPHGPFGGSADPYYFYLALSSADVFPLMAAEGRGADLSVASQRADGYAVTARYPNGAQRTFFLNPRMELIRDMTAVERESFKLRITREYSGYKTSSGARLPEYTKVTIEGEMSSAGTAQRIKQARELRLRKSECGMDIDPSLFAPGFPASIAAGTQLQRENLVFSYAGETPVGDDPESIRIADVNGDGKPDILTGDDGGVSYLVGDGSGAFDIRMSLPGGGGSNECALPVDLDGDGRLDIAVASTAAPESTLFLILNRGQSRFNEPVEVKTGDFPESIAAADFDGDGAVDLAVAHNLSGDVWVHYGDGRGGMARSVPLKLGGRGENVATADLNEDGLPDLLAVDQQRLYVFLNASDGFGEPAVLEAGPFPFCLVSADFNADGHADVLVGNGGIFRDAGEQDFALFYGKGDGSLAEPLFISAGASIAGVDAADLNGDGAADVVASSFGTHEAVLLINEDGALVNAGTLPVNWSPSAVALADLNGDGNIDIAVANEFADSVSIWLNRGPAQR